MAGGARVITETERKLFMAVERSVYRIFDGKAKSKAERDLANRLAYRCALSVVHDCVSEVPGILPLFEKKVSPKAKVKG
jgi:hypothetical protein